MYVGAVILGKLCQVFGARTALSAGVAKAKRRHTLLQHNPVKGHAGARVTLNLTRIPRNPLMLSLSKHYPATPGDAALMNKDMLRQGYRPALRAIFRTISRTSVGVSPLTTST